MSHAHSSNRLLLRALIVGVLLLGALAPGAAASHFRGGNINYQQTGAPTNAAFESTTSFRCSAFFSNPCDAAVGDSVFIAEAVVEFGDGTSTDSQYTVVAVNAAEDFFVARKSVSHNYADTSPRNAFYSSCCTISELQNNNDANFVISTLVNLAADPNSPKTNVPPVVNVGNTGNQTFTVPATDPGGQTLRFRLASDAESGGFNVNPPTGYAINATTGQVTFDTDANDDGLYHSSVVIEARSPANTVVSSTLVTFLVRVGQGVGNQAPVFDAPTPADGTSFTVAPGQNLTLSLKASDGDAGDTVDLVPGALPAGAVFNDTPGNPVTGSLSFTPSAAQDGQDFIVNITAQDGNGGSVFRSYTIRVRTPTPSAGRMGGKGSLNDTDAGTAFSGPASFAYVLACNPGSNPVSPRQNPLEVRWGTSVFRTTSVPSNACSTTAGGTPAGFDTMTGNATGTLTTGGSTVAATATFRFFDGGAGPDDRSRIVVTSSGTTRLIVDGAPGKFPGSSQPTGYNTATP